MREQWPSASGNGLHHNERLSYMGRQENNYLAAWVWLCAEKSALDEGIVGKRRRDHLVYDVHIFDYVHVLRKCLCSVMCDACEASSFIPLLPQQFNFRSMHDHSSQAQ